MNNENEILVVESWHIRVWRRYQASWFDKHFRFSLPVAVVFFAMAEAFNFWAINQATYRAGAAVPDVILSNIPVFEVDGWFIYGTLVFAVFGALVLLSHPKRIPFALHALTLFVIIRAVFTLLTHLGSPEASYASDFGATINNAFFGADQFFSGHVGMPFLGALILWHKPLIRYVFLAGSAFFAVVVLLGHIHYTIDVMAAIFITYGIYHLALWLFPREHELFLH